MNYKELTKVTDSLETDRLKPSKVTNEFLNDLKKFILSKGCTITGDRKGDELIFFAPPEGPKLFKECDEWLDNSGIREWIEENGPGDVYVGTDSVEEWVRNPKPDECYCFYSVSEDRHYYPGDPEFEEKWANIQEEDTNDRDLSYLEDFVDKFIDLICDEEYTEAHKLWENLSETEQTDALEVLPWELTILEINKVIPSHFMDKFTKGEI